MDTEQEALAKTGKASKAARFGWGIYQQVAAVFAAFGVAAMLRQLGVDWRGFLTPIVAFWDLTVRPMMTWVFHVVVTEPLGWIGVHLEVPLWARDYLSVGLILMLSALRARRSRREKVYGSFLTGFALLDRHALGNAAAFLLWPISIIVVMVLWLAAMTGFERWAASVRHVRARDGEFVRGSARELILSRGRRRRIMLEQMILEQFDEPDEWFYSVGARPLADVDAELRNFFFTRIRITILALSPLLYLALLLAVNFFVMPHIS